MNIYKINIYKLNIYKLNIYKLNVYKINILYIVCLLYCQSRENRFFVYVILELL